MSKLATTRMSSKGQVVIPEDIRHQLGLQSGDQFVVVAEGGVVVLKVIDVPELSELKGLIGQAKKEAKEIGLKKADVTDAIKSYRKSKK